MHNKPHTEETKRKIRKALKKKGLQSPSRFWKGKHHTETSRKKISENNGRYWLGKKGENSSGWKGGISFEIYPVDWTETLKRAIRERDNYICQKCSQYGETVHHIDYDKKNCNLDNLITLCRKCNTKVNFNREFWVNYFKQKVCCRV